MSTGNPYRSAGRPVSGSHFIERPELTERIEAVWQDPGRPSNLSLLGHRGTGRTSLIEHAMGKANRDDLGIIRLATGRYDTGMDVFRSMIHQAVMRFAPLAGLDGPCREALAAHDWYDLDHAARTFFQKVNELDFSLLYVLDDFDRAARVMTRLAEFQLLLDLAADNDFSVGLVTVSRRPVGEIEIDAVTGSVLEGVMGTPRHIGMFTPEQTDQMLAWAKDQDLASVRQEIMARSGPHPHLLRMLCEQVVEVQQATGRLDVDEAYAKVATSFQAHFAKLAQSIDLDWPSGGLDALRALAAGSGSIVLTPELNRLINMGVVTQDSDGLRLFAPEFASYIQTTVGSATSAARTAPPAPAPPAVKGDHRCVVLAVATEWKSKHGGLSTFNRQLCKALAAEGAKVFCMVLDATPDEVADAAAVNVTLCWSEPVPGAEGVSSLFRRPDLEGLTPDLVIGHGRITGPAAFVQAEDHFPDARRLHFVHMAPDEIEWHKLGEERKDDAAETVETRMRIETKLGRTSYRAVAVGPRLHGRVRGYLTDNDDPDPLRFDPGFDLEDARKRRHPNGSPLKILLVGRTEDSDLKGVGLAAEAAGKVAEWRHAAGRLPIELVVRGIPADKAAEQYDQLCKWANNSRLNIVPRLYTSDTERLADDLKQAALVVMPSKAEGFGLVGLEAIIAGTPVLVSDQSGLGELLAELFRDRPDKIADLVVPVAKENKVDVEVWARAMDGVLRYVKPAFTKAEELRRELAAQNTWSASAAALLKDLEL
ncbi:glycosyltransferase [Actinomadura hibisca]|uniref:glycosyltransferase n=1 Tax=Actinomadura hibisca TaxID=68565 RepID=UPI000830DA87|nr:glycosyltransferase [Actinomadura hibisca]